jgi:hypothetical protein
MLRSSGGLASKNILKVTPEVKSSGIFGFIKCLLHFESTDFTSSQLSFTLLLLLSSVVEKDQLHTSVDYLLVVNVLWCSDRTLTSNAILIFELVN